MRVWLVAVCACGLARAQNGIPVMCKRGSIEIVEAWREVKIPERCERLIRQGLLDICQFNTQPLMMCTLWDRTYAELWNWNVVNYGWKPNLPIDRHTMASIHWNGPSKGWDPDNEYHHAFAEYAVSAEARAEAVAAKRSEDAGLVDVAMPPAESPVEIAEHRALHVAAC